MMRASLFFLRRQTKQSRPSKHTRWQEAFRLLLGQTRLSILDLSPAGHQPMRSACGRYTLTYNGEVYNYRELRDELRAEGVSFHSETDTEVVLQALIRWGKSALCKFSGMFAFAMFDAQKTRCFAHRCCR